MSLSSFLLGEKATGKQKSIDTELDALFQTQVRLFRASWSYRSLSNMHYIFRFIRHEMMLVLQRPMTRSVNLRVREMVKSMV